MTARDDTGTTGATSGIGTFLELLALCGVVFLQPTLDVLANNASVFVTRGTGRVELVLFVLALALVPPLVAWGLVLCARAISPSLGRWVHALVVAVLCGVLAVEVVARLTSQPRRTMVLLALPAAALGVWLITRFVPVRMWVRLLALATPLFALNFLVFSPAHDAVFGSGPGSGADVAVGEDARVVMVVFDELPVASLLDGHGAIDPVLFPNFARLAGTSTWYRNTSAVAGYTQVAVPSILTGRYPHEAYPVPTATTYPHSLFTLLGGTYDLNVHESATRLCPGSLCRAGDGSAAGDDGSGGGMAGLLGEAWTAWHRFAWPDRSTGAIRFADGSPSEADALRTGNEFVRSLRPAPRARLDFLHLLLPHQPWHYLPTGQDYEQGTAPGAPFYLWVSDYAARSAQQRHLLQLQAADRLLGRIVARLHRLQAFDDSLLVVTADHGVAFEGLSSLRGAAADNFHEVAWVPFFVKAPRQGRAVVDDQPVQTIDVLPTIADHLDTELPWPVDGRSALGRRRRPGRVPFFTWDLNLLKAPKGSDFVQLDGKAGFMRMLRERASAATGDPDLRLYRAGPYGHLVGTPVAGRVDDGVPASSAAMTASVDHLERYRDVDLDAPIVPWAYLTGHLDGPAGTPVAVVGNGRILAVADSQKTNGAGSDLWTLLPPKLLRQGHNDLQLYAVRGDARDPTLEPIRLG